MAILIHFHVDNNTSLDIPRLAKNIKNKPGNIKIPARHKNGNPMPIGINDPPNNIKEQYIGLNAMQKPNPMNEKSVESTLV